MAIGQQQVISIGDADCVFRLNPLAACVKTAIAGSVLMVFVSPVAAELPVPSAVWASMGGATHEVIGNTMNIKQETDKVILNWDKFNVSADSTVNFKQPSASSIALNKIAQQDPSRILGTVNANGQVYLVNKNGFVFGKDSVVNARGLVTSTLDISEQTLQEGIGKVANIDQRAAFEGSGDFYRKNADGSFMLDAEGHKIPIKIAIEQGAKIKSDEGGRILVIAPTIENSGDVESSGGQVIMAAATDKVYLQEAPVDAPDVKEADKKPNSDVRGLLVEVQTGGKVENLGNIAANRGNVTLMGFAVNQNGRVSATTTTNLNGTIRLLAREGGSAVKMPKGNVDLVPAATTRAADNGDGLGRSATVSIGENSRTEILPEVEYGEESVAANGEVVKVIAEKTAIDAQAQPQSRVEVMAHKVHLQSGAEIVAPAGKVEITATRTPANPVADNRAANDSRVLIDAGAKIDVSGTDSVVKPMESNIVEVELRNFELKDAPLQKNGILKGKTVLIDIREGSPLTDIQPTVAGIKRTVAERLSKGGDIVLRSEGDVVVENGSVLDISGGEINFLAGNITTTKLLANGRLIDIGDADPLMSYDGIYGEVSKNYKKWGVTRTWNIDGPFTLSRFERGYVEGKDAGSLAIRANRTVLEGQVLAQTVNGRYQRDVADQAKGGRLEVDSRFSFDNVQSVVFTGNSNNPLDLDLDIDELLPNGLATTLAIQAGMLFDSGIRDAVFLANGKISVADNATVKLADGGSLKLRGGAIEVDGNIRGAGATVELETAVVTGDANLDGDIVVADGATIDLRGQWINDFAEPDNIDGKSIAIDGGRFLATVGGNAGGNLSLRKGSVIDVSGGGRLRADRKLDAGDGGTISLIADPGVDNTGANIEMDGMMHAYALGQGGHFIAKANAVAIRRQEDEVGGDGVKPLQISTDFFGQGGFSDFDIGSNTNGLSVEDGAVIVLSQKNRILNADYVNQRNADGIAGFSTIGVLRQELRGPSSLTLRANHAAGVNPDSQLTFAAGAAIVADNGSSVTMESDSSLTVDGDITAHGGSVALRIVPDKSGVDPQYQATQGIWLGSDAKVDVSGAAQIVVDGVGRRGGEVLDGGRFTVDVQRGFYVAQAGSTIDVSGSQATLDLPTNTPGSIGLAYQATTVGSHAGTIDITAAEGAFIAGDMAARGGNAAGTAGGSLSLFLNVDKRKDPNLESSTFPNAARTVLLSQQRHLPFSQQFDSAGDALPAALAGKGYLSAEQIAAGGFSSLALAVSGDNGEIRFVGDVDLKLSNALALDAVKFGWQRANAADTGLVALSANTATLGSDTYRTPTLAPTGGDGRLQVHANLIDMVGGSMTSGFGAVDLHADGDIRLKGIRVDNQELDFVGQFKTYSKLNLTAAQVYPTSLTTFTLAVAGDADGSVTIEGNGNQVKPVLSAMGKLTVQAPHIVQNGALNAPLGEIALQATQSVKFGANSVTSVSAAGQIVPLGVTQGGLEWLLPLAGTGNNLNVVNPDVKKSDTDKKAIFEAPQKKITVAADKIQREEGAVVDLSGGGDMLAYEFIPGDGGSKDVLDSSQVYAVLPGISDYSPYDPKSFPDSGLKTGDNVYLSGGSGLAAGYYALLPARYALLPGAFLVTPVAGAAQVAPGSSRVRVDGAAIVSGYRGISGTDIRDQSWSEFVVEDGAIAKTRSEYNINYASRFFADRAVAKEVAIPRLPNDAGQLVLNAKTALELPTVKADVAAGGRGGLVDIVSDKLAIGATDASDDIELLAGDIEKFNVDSLLLGAVRSFDPTTGHIKLDVQAKSVTIADNTTVKAPELILAASEKVELKAGSRIEASGNVAGGDEASVLETNGDGALLRASAGKQAAIVRTGTSGAKGELRIASGASIAAGSGSVLLDSTRTTVMNGGLELDGGSLNLGAEVINLGETSGVATTGLSLDNERLSRLTVAELVLTSRGMVNIVGQLPQTDAEGRPFQFGKLVIDAKGLAGRANAGQTAILNAGTLTMTNNNPGGSVVAGDGSGHLAVNVDQLVLDKGNYRITGFADATFDVSQRVLGRGEGRLTSVADLTINTPLMTAENGAKTTIDLPGYSLTLNHAGDAREQYASQGIAAQLWLEANAIDLNTALAYQTGKVSLYALTGDVALDDRARIDVSGAVVQAGLSAPVAVDGGAIVLNAKQGNVTASAASHLLLNAVAGDASAGELTASAAAGEVRLAGVMEAEAASKSQGGRIAVDTGRLGADGFSAWIARMADGGFSGAIDFRLRGGDLAVDAGKKLTAETIKLTADSGKIKIGGELDASGSNGGVIALASEDALTLQTGAELKAGATAANGNGGKVLLSAIDSAADGAGIEIQTGAYVDVSPQGDGKQGEVHLRADRKDSDGNGVADVDIKPIAAGTITGDSDVRVEAWRGYQYSRIDQAVQDRIAQDNLDYMNGVAADGVAASRFGNGFSIVPGVEVSSSGDMTIADAWDLSAWRYGDASLPGVLTLRAKGNLLVQQSLSDGFVYHEIQTPYQEIPFSYSDYLQSGRSWDLNLVAGADVQSADRTAVVTASGLSNPLANGDVKLANDVKLRTGTGDISVRAARNIDYGNSNSVIYTAGRPDEANRWGSGGLDLALYFYAEYPLDGGDIQLQAGGNINAKPTSQLLSDALVRTGNWSRNTEHGGERPTAWGIAFGYSDSNGYVSNHQQSVASFGGGQVSVKAGGNVNDLSVFIPTTGKPVGAKASADDPTNLDFTSNVVEINGGGDLKLVAGGDVAGGVFYVDGGTAELSAAGSFKAGTNTLAGRAMKPIVALGDAEFDITAGKGLALEAILDPMFSTLAAPADAAGIQNRFFRYGSDSAVKLTALSGDISLDNDPKRLNQAGNTQLPDDSFLVYPASLKAGALNGDLAINKGFTLFPSPQGGLELYAKGNITGNGTVHLSDAEPAALPSAALPLNELNTELLRIMAMLDPTNTGADAHAANPLHLDDTKPVFISTGNGNIGSRIGSLGFVLAKPVEVSAGRDVIKTLLKIQHNAPGAASVVHAGRDINFPVTFNTLNGKIDEVEQGIEVAGPGQLTVLAGRDVNLGASNGIVSTGDQTNSALADDGADVSVIAGLAQGGMDVDGFSNGFLVGDDSPARIQDYQQRLIDEIRLVSGDSSLSLEQAKLAFANLSVADKTRVSGKLLDVVQPLFIGEIKHAATTLAAATTKQDQDQAELSMLAAIEALFPGTTLLAGRSDYRVEPGVGVVADGGAGALLNSIYANQGDRPALGNILLFLSTIQTKDGGNVNLFAPNGGITVGLATADIGLEKEEDQMGVIVKKLGDANLIARKDVDVNIRRVVTLGGGDILGGSFEEDADAGRSPQTSLAAPPLQVSYDADSQVVLEVAPVLAGGGIRATGEGNVTLFAPRGIIDAGEAGISGNNVTLAATAIVGADNIDVGGASVGIPVAPTGSIAAGLTGVSNMAATVGKSVESAADVGKDAADTLAKAASAFGILSVEILGFGE